MRGFLSILILGYSSSLLGQDFQILTSGDSVTIQAPNIATNYSFDFGTSPLSYLIKFNPRVKTQTIENMHVENKVDTIYNLSIGADKFIVYKVDKVSNILLDAEVLTTKFKTKQGIRIGMRKQEVGELLSAYKLKVIPKYLILENEEVAELITFTFNKDILTKITYDGYID